MPHNAVMDKLRPHMGPTRFTTWEADGSTLPVAWDDALTRLRESSAATGSEEP
ncbi:hypothetical protein [Pseudonocardia broussonetiae]|uniref:Uncharacterized protein n=1 Tax=Pseudonocardia broussonetiae TaxID=2736640 RepID=A0A6M6JS05_9PSEU|nr:hypothetical protein [Pseudonocardia broussonetiae]QJY49021.1 hypothetical protein HOP40_27270 [Pseudonocardia broussonetiae]